METTIKTSFNFAKEIQCNFITKNNPEHSYPGGLPEFITPYLQELQENTIIPDYTTLISITTIDNPDQDGIHILTFLKNDPEHFDDDDTASITCIECLRDTFAYDPSVPVNQITNKIITNLINYLPEYPWYEYIYNSNDQFDENLPELINAGNHFISLYINTDDCLIEFSTEQPDSSDNLCEDLSLTTAGITFTIYFD